jgi:uncharacterized membrane protein YqjE
VASPLVESLRRLGAASSKLLLSRAEFASLELAEARGQILRWFVLALLTMSLLLLALIAGSALFVVLLWPTLGWVALILVVLAYALGATILGLRLHREIAAAPPPLSETLRQLTQDRETFAGGHARETSDGYPPSEPPRESFR